MTKQEAIDIFGSQTKLAHALGITASAVSQWSPNLTAAQADRVVGAAVRLKKMVCPSQADGAAQKEAAA